MSGMCKNSESLTPIYFWFLQVLILWGALAAIILLSITPNSPIYTITDVRGNFSLLNQTSFIRNNSLIFNIEISNPNNRIGVYFDYIHMTLNHNGSTVGNEQHVPGFYQGFKWTTPCKVAVKADQKFLKWVAGGGTTELRVGLKTVVRYEIFGWKTKHHPMNVAARVPIFSYRNIIAGKMMNITLHHQRI
ncbi:NDR1/HIN1-like protein 3 [Ziziphus jujuba]|uniref:NDR1/HIN1-like protein 3 n=1 Tax=Ziziphus jujuba TaxID=326968 RepID=A0A6P4A670_ZIZJJ|nr:NDR1/HIN1-like protein 3 [Ziziphus jujuba]